MRLCEGGNAARVDGENCRWVRSRICASANAEAQIHALLPGRRAEMGGSSIEQLPRFRYRDRRRRSDADTRHREEHDGSLGHVQVFDTATWEIAGANRLSMQSLLPCVDFTEDTSATRTGRGGGGRVPDSLAVDGTTKPCLCSSSTTSPPDSPHCVAEWPGGIAATRTSFESAPETKLGHDH